MARQEQVVIQSRLGEQIVDKSKIIYFPRGVVGFENLHEFTLLQIREGTPMLILQSLDEPSLGLLVTDPYVFLPNYSLKVGDPEQKLLCLEDPADATILVTVSIPHGKPQLTSLNLTGPIVINAHKKFGLQVPQADANPSHILIESLKNEQDEQAQHTNSSKIEQINNSSSIEVVQKPSENRVVEEIEQSVEAEVAVIEETKPTLSEEFSTEDVVNACETEIILEIEAEPCDMDQIEDSIELALENNAEEIQIDLNIELVTEESKAEEVTQAEPRKRRRVLVDTTKSSTIIEEAKQEENINSTHAIESEEIVTEKI